MSDRAIAFLLLGMGIAYLIWGITELRSGKARFHWPGSLFSEDEGTLLYSIAVALKFLALPLAALMSWGLPHT
jgi:hypothetical protein